MLCIDFTHSTDVYTPNSKVKLPNPTWNQSVSTGDSSITGSLLCLQLSKCAVLLLWLALQILQALRPIHLII